MTQIDDRPAQQPRTEALAPVKAPEVKPAEKLPPARTPEVKGRRKLSRGAYVAIGGTALATTAAVVAAVLLGPNAPAKTATPDGAPTPDDRGTNAPSPAASEQAPGQEKLTVKNLEIKSGLDDQAFAKSLFEDKFTLWLMAGATDETNKEFITYKLQPQPNGTTEQPATKDFVVPLAEKESKPFISALYVDGFSDPNGTVSNRVQANAGDLEAFLLTYKSDDPRDKEAYSHSYKVKGVSGTDTATGRSLEVTVIEHDNAANNRIGSVYASSVEPNKIDGSKVTYDITTRVVGGVEKIVSESVKR